jgi:hypothetical protein
VPAEDLQADLHVVTNNLPAMMWVADARLACGFR